MWQRAAVGIAILVVLLLAGYWGEHHGYHPNNIIPRSEQLTIRHQSIQRSEPFLPREYVRTYRRGEILPELFPHMEEHNGDNSEHQNNKNP